MEFRNKMSTINTNLSAMSLLIITILIIYSVWCFLLCHYANTLLRKCPRGAFLCGITELVSRFIKKQTTLFSHVDGKLVRVEQKSIWHRQQYFDNYPHFFHPPNRQSKQIQRVFKRLPKLYNHTNVTLVLVTSNTHIFFFLMNLHFFVALLSGHSCVRSLWSYKKTCALN